MIGARIVLKRGSSDEAEKPFWISFADLMTALMVLFVLVMSVALLAVTKTVSEAERKKAEREHDIQRLLDKVQKAAAPFGVIVDRKRQVVDFGDRARFDTGSYQLSREQSKLLRSFVPKVLDIARDELGTRVLKRIVVEGYTDQRGTYLYNLNLSMQRSQRVLCGLFEKPGHEELPMTNKEQEEVRELFLVGGYSFNSTKPTLEESRRIELRLEFLAVDEARPKAEIAEGNFGVCAI